MQSGFYIDFFVKKLSEIFVRNVFIYTALFFGEKYMIEVLTKKIIENLIFKLNRFFGWTSYNYCWFFFTILILSLYFLTIINILYIFFI